MPWLPVVTHSANATVPPIRTNTLVPNPKAPPRATRSWLEEQLWQRQRRDTIGSGLEGAWTTEPSKWDNNYFDNLFGYEWELTKSPAGAHQWTPTDESAVGTVPDAHDPSKKHAPMMLTTDLALREDPIYAPISKRFHENPDQLADAFAKAWYKLTHRDMGPRSRYLGPLVPAEPQLLEDPVPNVDHELIGDRISLNSRERFSLRDCPFPSWSRPPGRRRQRSVAPTSGWGQRGSHSPGSAEGLGSQPADRAREGAADAGADPADFNSSQSGGKKVSLADMIVLGGCAAVEAAAKKAGHGVQVPFAPGRTDALPELTDVDSFAVLEPTADGFRNYVGMTA